MTLIDIDLFAAGGGWEQGAQQLGIRPIGFELDLTACRTAVAAGHSRVQVDISRLATSSMRGKVRGLIASPPCTTFSAAGKGAGAHVMDILAAGLRDTLRGEHIIGRTRNQAARVLKAQALTTHAHRSRAERTAWARQQATTSCLVLEVARFARDLHPEWIACEQVPGVLPLWQTLAHELRGHGYSTWAGVLNAANYGVPQTRQRAFLIANRTRPVTPPAPTHAQRPGDGDLFGGPLLPWVSMATALGWGATARPVPTITSGGTAAGGAEPLARGGRDALLREREREGRWIDRVPATSGCGDD